MAFLPPSISLCDAAVKLKSSLSQYRPPLRTDSCFVFLCGANKSASRQNPIRDTLEDYAKKHFNGFLFFRAEKVFDAIKGRKTDDLLTLEDKIADFSDCIIVVCESESTFAELGAFTLSDKIVSQVLIINDSAHRLSQSFITLGPIARADRKSTFRPTIHANFSAILKSAVEIEERLKRIQRYNRQSIDFTSQDAFRSTSAKLRLLFLADLIHLFFPTKIQELAKILQFIFGHGYYDIDLEVGVLESLGFIKRTQAGWLHYSGNNPVFFYDYIGLKPTILRASIVRHFFQNEPSRLELLAPKDT